GEQAARSYLRAWKIHFRSRFDTRLDGQHQRALRGWLAVDTDRLQPRQARPVTALQARLERQAPLGRSAVEREFSASCHVPRATAQSSGYSFAFDAFGSGFRARGSRPGQSAAATDGLLRHAHWQAAAGPVLRAG